MSTASHTPTTEKNLSETQLITAVISGIAIFSSVFVLEGSLISLGIVLGGTFISGVIGQTLSRTKLTHRASMRVILGGTLISFLFGATVYTTGLLILPAVFISVFILFAVVQLFIYF